MRQHREFDSSAESGGAPVECKHPGYTPHVLLREGGERFGVVRFPDSRQRSMQWTEKGRAYWHNDDMDLVMSPIDFVQGQAVFQGDIVYRGRRRVAVNASQMGAAPPWAGATLAPVEPQDVHEIGAVRYIGPKPCIVATRMTGKELFKLGRELAHEYGHANEGTAYTHLANAIIARAIADGQVAPACDVQKLKHAIAQVQTAAPRIMLEQVAAHMQQIVLEALLAKDSGMGWIGRDIAANIVRCLDINKAVDKVLAPGAQEEKL